MKKTHKKTKKNNTLSRDNTNDSKFLIWNHGSQQELAHHFSSAERKSSGKLSFRNDQEIKMFSDGRKSVLKFLLVNISVSMAKGKSLNRKEIIKKTTTKP